MNFHVLKPERLTVSKMWTFVFQKVPIWQRFLANQLGVFEYSFSCLKWFFGKLPPKSRSSFFLKLWFSRDWSAYWYSKIWDFRWKKCWYQQNSRGVPPDSYILDVLWVRCNCAKFHHCRICVTDFRDRGDTPIRQHPWNSPSLIELSRIWVFP